MSKPTNKNKPRKWYTVAYFTREGQPHPAYQLKNFTRHHIQLSLLVSDLRASFAPNLLRGAYAAVVWEGQLDQWAALHDPTKIPVKYVLEDGSILDRLP